MPSQPPGSAAACTAANGAVYNAGYRNSDRASDHYDNNTGQARPDRGDEQGLRRLADRRSTRSRTRSTSSCSRATATRNTRAGLDDDSFFDDFLSFPEIGSADQQSVELQATGKSWCASTTWSASSTTRRKDRTSRTTRAFNCGTEGCAVHEPANGGDFFLHQKYDS